MIASWFERESLADDGLALAFNPSHLRRPTLAWSAGVHREITCMY